MKGKARNYVSSVNLRHIHCLQEVNEPIRHFAIRLSITAKRCNLDEVAVEKICMHTFKKNSVPHIQKLLANLLPSVKFDDAVLHAVKYEESGVFAHGEDRKSIKRKYDDVMTLECPSDEEDPALVAKLSTKIAKSFEAQMCNLNAKLDALNRKANGEDHPTINKAFKKSTICFHCAKQGHSFNDCRSAKPEDRSRIAGMLKSRSFDFKELTKRNEDYKRSLNSKPSVSRNVQVSK